MRITGVGSGYFMPQYSGAVQAGRTGAAQQVVSKEWMEKLLNLTLYNQMGLTYKLVRIATENYVKLSGLDTYA